MNGCAEKANSAARGGQKQMNGGARCGLFWLVRNKRGNFRSLITTRFLYVERLHLYAAPIHCSRLVVAVPRRGGVVLHRLPEAEREGEESEEEEENGENNCTRGVAAVTDLVGVAVRVSDEVGRGGVRREE